MTEPVTALTAALESAAAFSYLRLGDGELDFLLKVQGGESEHIHTHPEHGSIEVAHCCPGLSPESAGRLLESYEQADYVDLHTHLDFNRRNIDRLRWTPREGQRQGSGPTQAGLLQPWTIREMPAYLSRHRCLFFGPEAHLLRELVEEPAYRWASGDFWSEAQKNYFLEPVGGGLDLSRHLDEFKEQIRRAMVERSCDTVFISLGGAAKIVASELARELKIRTVDFGSMMRMLTYSGSAGHASWRASYLPYLFRVAFSIYMKAYARAYPEARADKMLIKAQSQLCLELQTMTPGSATPSDVICRDSLDRSEESVARFCAAYASYRNWRGRLAWRSPACARAALAFEWWIIKKQIEPKGRLLAGLRKILKGDTCES